MHSQKRATGDGVGVLVDGELVGDSDGVGVGFGAGAAEGRRLGRGVGGPV